MGLVVRLDAGVRRLESEDILWEGEGVVYNGRDTAAVSRVVPEYVALSG